tara:strand:+ start:722 stop:1858 length:1137 start_codon:yes stop_codon:yes gene_type:complete
MNKSILNLFEHTRKEANDKLRHFNNDIYSTIPYIKHPEEESELFDEDIVEVERCFNSPCLNTSFLEKSDSKVVNVFKEYCNVNNIKNVDWDKIEEIVEDVEKIILKLKNQHERPRPFNYFNGDTSLSKKYKESFSYPSGHTTIAYFVCDLLGSYIPKIKQDCQTMASIIGQSRIDNGVHFPSDVSYGRLIGEMLADLYHNEEIPTNLKENKKSFVNLISAGLNNKESINSVTDEITSFLYESTNADYIICLEASKNLLMNYPTNYITEDITITSAVNCVNAAFNIGPIDNISKLIKVHQSINENLFFMSEPGEINNNINFTNIRKDINFILKKGSLSHKFKMLSDLDLFKENNNILRRVLFLSDLNYNFKETNKFLMS